MVFGRIAAAAALFASAFAAASDAHGQEAPKRLSDWLLEQPYSPDAYPLGLSWRVPEEKASQELLKRDLLESLSERGAAGRSSVFKRGGGTDHEAVAADPEAVKRLRVGADPEAVAADREAVARLREWLESLPVTGRVPVPVADARWLQANPARDPVLERNDTVVMPSRPGTVTVVTETGERCTVAHSYGYEAKAYLEACNPAAAARADWAWIAQPDGRVQRFGIATWNRERQDEPAPGAWLWGPARHSGWPELFSERLIRFLATQGPADDTPHPGALHHPAPQRGAPLPGEEGTHSVKPTPLLAPSPTPSSAPSPSLAPSSSAPPPPRSRSLEVTANDWGGAGLLQMPSARMAKAGTFTFSYSRVTPYTRGNIFVQPVDWLEAGFRYSAVTNRLYSADPNFSGSQNLKDKSFDAKFKLRDESAWGPQVAVGFRDLAGTGLFSGEYVVANKRTDAFDWSLGLGWGYVGARGNLRNPLRIFGSKFDTRKGLSPEAGSPLFSSYFRGPTSLFGGVQYQTPWQPLILKLEYDGNDYQHEPQANNQPVKSPWNFGLVYRARWADLSLGVERGNTVMASVTLFTGLDTIHMPKLNDPPRPRVVASRPVGKTDWAATSKEIERQVDWNVHRIAQRGGELRVTLDDPTGTYLGERVERVVAVLHRDAPASVDRFALIYRDHGVELAEHVIDRDAWVVERTRFVPPGERYGSPVAQPPETVGGASVYYEKSRPRFETGIGLDYQQTLGGPEGFVLYQFSGALRSTWRIRDDTWVRGIFRQALINNYDRFKVDGPSNLPRVRTFLREYLTTSSFTMPLMQVTHFGRLGDNQYYSLYAGYFEEMFGGVGGEWLYRPFASPVAYGVDVNAVKARDFKQDFGFRDYRVLTGHATAYWDTGWHDLLAKVSFGRYLAKDVGVTMDVSRVFKNGITVGAFVTKTNVSAATFGEGSFDKGVYIAIAYDAMLTKSSGSTANFVWRPLTRDGGSKLARYEQLYDLTRTSDERALWYAPAPVPNEAAPPEDRREDWTPRPEKPEPYLRVRTRPTLAQWNADARYEHALVEALYAQRFRNIRVSFDQAYRLNVAVANESVRPASRAVGRAARTALRFAPLEMREIRVVFAERADPVVTYDFVDAERLARYFAGEIGRAEIADTIAVEYQDPSVRETDPLARLGDLDTLDDTPKFSEQVLPEGRTTRRVKQDVREAVAEGAKTDWVRFGVLGGGLVLGSSILDRRAFRFAEDHADNRWMKMLTTTANLMPWVGMGAAGLAALDGSDPRLSKTGYASVEAGAAGFFAATAIKYLVGRARPETGLGSTSFKPGSTAANRDAFPSRHTSVTWALATPFALEYGADWLYGVAAVSNLGRITSREHWVSDTVAGSLVGYAIGRLFWESSRAQSKGVPRVLLNRSGISLAWQLGSE